MVSPLTRVLGQHDSLIATQVASSVLTPLLLAADASLLCTMPFALIQLWRFAAKGLYRRERQQLFGSMLISLILFLLGALFCFFIVLPLMFHLFAQAMPSGVKFMPDINAALAFITRMLLLFGLCFQVPLLCVALVQMHWLSLSTLKQIRPYMIVAAFIIGMLLTPPDVLSQILLAVPLCLLYELGVALASWRQRTSLSLTK